MWSKSELARQTCPERLDRDGEQTYIWAISGGKSVPFVVPGNDGSCIEALPVSVPLVMSRANAQCFWLCQSDCICFKASWPSTKIVPCSNSHKLATFCCEWFHQTCISRGWPGAYTAAVTTSCHVVCNKAVQTSDNRAGGP